jgi:hypothetical protein
MVAIAVALLIQVPPPVASLRVALPPWQTVEEPVMEAGIAFTVTTLVVVPHDIV